MCPGQHSVELTLVFNWWVWLGIIDLENINIEISFVIFSDSPTPLKRSGPGDLDTLPDTPPHKLYCPDSYAVSWYFSHNSPKKQPRKVLIDFT